MSAQAVAVPVAGAPGTSRRFEPGAIGSDGELIACTICDALHRVGPIPRRGRLRCSRCSATLLRDPGGSIDSILASSLAMAILLVSSVFFPFLQVSASGLRSAASLLDTALAFSGGITAPLTLALFLLIVIIPVLRAALLYYALLPLRLDLRALPYAQRAFRLASELRPWSMAEVFIIGVIVALVKIGGMADVMLGPAFWELTLIVGVVALEASSLCEKTIWRILEATSGS
jgi:paraquat-inducible protein A